MNRNDRWAGWQRDHSEDSPTEQRLAFTKVALQRPPRSTPGTETFYTGDGYIVAGAMMERLTGLDWEQLVRTHLFDPLELRSRPYELQRCPDMKPAGSAGRLSLHRNRPNMALNPLGRRRASWSRRCPTCCDTSTFTCRASAKAADSCSGRHSSVCIGRSTPSHTLWAGRPMCSAMTGAGRGTERVSRWLLGTIPGEHLVRARNRVGHGNRDESRPRRRLISADIFHALLREFGVLPAPAPQ